MGELGALRNECIIVLKSILNATKLVEFLVENTAFAFAEPVRVGAAADVFFDPDLAKLPLSNFWISSNIFFGFLPIFFWISSYIFSLSFYGFLPEFVSL